MQAKVFKIKKWLFYMAVKINDLIFKELIKRGYSVEGKTRVWNIADSKLWYLTPEQAQGYLDLEKSSEYQKDVNQAGDFLVGKNMKEIMASIGSGPLNIVDLGCGDGRKACQVMKYLKDKNRLRYCPIDISGYMVAKAIETAQKTKIAEIVEFKYNISDFENLDNLTPLLTNGEYQKNLFLLLGNTLGNFEVNDMLYKIRSGMNNGDLLLIATGIDDYKGDARAIAYKNNKMWHHWLGLLIGQLGLSASDVELDARFANKRIEMFYVLKKDKTIEFLGKKVEFKKGDEIIVLVAYKHDIEDLKEYLNIHFDSVEIKVSKDHSTALALCKKGK